MDALDLWKICDRVTLFQVVMLCLNCDPQDMTEYSARRRGLPREYDATLAALKSGLLTKAIQGEVIPYQDSYEQMIEGSIDPDRTTVDLKSVGHFLQGKGVNNPLCPTNHPHTPDYLNPSHPCYAPKLAAAIHAWLAVVKDPTALKGKTPKNAMEKWLRLNAKSYGLTKEKDGLPNETGIEEICKVANWKQSGGAAKTSVEEQAAPDEAPKQTHPPLNYLKEEKKEEVSDDIPF